MPGEGLADFSYPPMRVLGPVIFERLLELLRIIRGGLSPGLAARKMLCDPVGALPNDSEWAMNSWPSIGDLSGSFSASASLPGI